MYLSAVKLKEKLLAMELLGHLAAAKGVKLRRAESLTTPKT